MLKQLVSGKHRLRNTYWSLVGAASAMILSVQPVMAETIWDRFSTIMRDIYGQLVGISTIVAVTVAAIALLVRMVSRNQRAVDEATSWLKRVVVTWIIADRFLYLRDGRIAAEYAPRDLLLPEADILGMGLRSPHEGKCLPTPSVLDESPAVLKTAGLSKRIRKEVIFEDISLSVPEGGVTAITGQNGAGKTTLAQILCGLARQTRGHILIDGKKARAAVRRREIYYCGNDTSTQFFTASVAEELLLNTGLTEENKDRARHLLKEFGLYEYRDAHPSTLSGGQKQRLAIACAIFSGRRILILDEPTSGLDGQNMRLIAERLKSEARSGRTILVITHDRELIESCCDRIAKIGVKFGEGDVA